MKKGWFLGLGLILGLFLYVAPLSVEAASLSDEAVATASVGKYSEVELFESKTTTIKLVVKEKGTVTLDFNPNPATHVNWQLFNSKAKQLLTDSSFSLEQLPLKNLAAGTYYLRMWSTYSNQHIKFLTSFKAAKEPAVSLGIQLKKNQSVQLATLFSNTKAQKLKWTTSNRGIVAVSQKGAIKGMKKGTATIKVTSTSGLVASVRVTVK